MRPLIATVITSAVWEPELVEFARRSASLRVGRRCTTPRDVDDVAHRIDALVIGTETPWLSAPLLRRLRAQGVPVVGVVAEHDRAGHHILTDGKVAAVVHASDPPARILAAISSVAEPGRGVDHLAVVASVTGPRGAPGRTEVALALAWATAPHTDTLLVELDADAPGLGLRLGLEPVVSAAPTRQAAGPLAVLTLPARGGPLSSTIANRLIEGARSEFESLVIDAGPTTALHGFVGTTRQVLVVDPSPAGLVRAGHMIARWQGTAPVVVANRVPAGPDHSQALRMIRAATGLEPAAAIPALPIVIGEPHPRMTALLEPLARAVFGRPQRSAAR